MDRWESFQKVLQELVEGLVKEKTQDRLDALINYVEGRLQGFTEGFTEALQNLRIQAVDLEVRNSLEEHRKKVTEKLKEARDVMDVLSQGLEKHTKLIKSVAEKLAEVSDAVGVVDKKVNDFWEKYHAELEQTNLRLESLQTSFETLRETINSQVNVALQELKQRLESLRDTINLQFKALREEFSTALWELEQKVSEGERGLESFKETVKELSASLQELRGEVEQRLDMLNSQVKALREENEALRGRIHQLEEEREVLKQELLKQLAELYSKVNDWRGEVMANLERLFAQVESLQRAKDAFPDSSPR